MGKALGLLPSWYWPERVQRYLAAPRVAIYDLAVSRWARRYGDDPALIAVETALSFRELDAACGRVAAAIGERFPGRGARVALGVRSGETFAPLFLGLLRANTTLLVLDGPADASLREFEPSLVISDMPGLAGESPDTLLAGAASPTPVRPATIDPVKPAIALTGRNGLAWHSHASLMSAAMAFAAFVALDTKAHLVVSRPTGSWEGLIGLLAPLQAGGAAIGCDAADETAVARLTRGLRPAVVWTEAASAERLLDAHNLLATAVRDVRPKVYVSVTRTLPTHLRRALRRRLRAHVLAVYGYPDCGPITADHASWYLDDSVGIPMVGVDVLALNPRTDEPSDLPWPVLSYAGVGVSTQAVATNGVRAAASGTSDGETRWYVTGDHGLLDSNGMLFLRDR
jgi:acyl-CoA synthetase (AMP-forming)/AMP-acid ligase II